VHRAIIKPFCPSRIVIGSGRVQEAGNISGSGRVTIFVGWVGSNLEIWTHVQLWYKVTKYHMISCSITPNTTVYLFTDASPTSTDAQIVRPYWRLDPVHARNCSGTAPTEVVLLQTQRRSYKALTKAKHPISMYEHGPLQSPGHLSWNCQCLVAARQVGMRRALCCSVADRRRSNPSSNSQLMQAATQLMQAATAASTA